MTCHFGVSQLLQTVLPIVFSALTLVRASYRPLMDVAEEAALEGRIIRRLQATLPNELEFEADKILADEPGCTKRHIIFAIGYCRSQGVAWSWAVRELQQRLIRETNTITID